MAAPLLFLGEEGGGEDGDGKPKLHYAVQLALYIDILERLGLSAGRHAFVWDINGEEVPYDFSVPLGPKKPWTLWDDLTLIPYLGRSLRDAMKDTVPSIAALAASNPDAFMKGKKTIFPGLGQDRLRLFHERAVMLSQPVPKPYLRSPISLRLAPVELFFDVEVDPLRDICYLHGIIERHEGRNETEKFAYFFAKEVTPEAERDAFAAAYAYLAGQAHAAIYFYSKYERTAYRKLQATCPEVCDADAIERLFDPGARC